MTPRETFGITEPADLRQQRANVCYMETITRSQPSTEVRRQENRQDRAIYFAKMLLLALIWGAAAAVGAITISKAMANAAHFNVHERPQFSAKG